MKKEKQVVLNLTEPAADLILKGLSKLAIEESGAFYYQLAEVIARQKMANAAPDNIKEETPVQGE